MRIEAVVIFRPFKLYVMIECHIHVGSVSLRRKDVFCALSLAFSVTALIETLVLEAS